MPAASLYAGRTSETHQWLAARRLERPSMDLALLRHADVGGENPTMDGPCQAGSRLSRDERSPAAPRSTTRVLALKTHGTTCTSIETSYGPNSGSWKMRVDSCSPSTSLRAVKRTSTVVGVRTTTCTSRAPRPQMASIRCFKRAATGSGLATVAGGDTGIATGAGAMAVTGGGAGFGTGARTGTWT